MGYDKQVAAIVGANQQVKDGLQEPNKPLGT